MLDTFPCSPALSACDSLDDQDLDALLAGLGSLSHFATPPLKDGVTVEIDEVLEDESEDDDDVDSLDCESLLRLVAIGDILLTIFRSPHRSALCRPDQQQSIHSPPQRRPINRRHPPPRPTTPGASSHLLQHPSPLHLPPISQPNQKSKRPPRRPPHRRDPRPNPKLHPRPPPQNLLVGPRDMLCPLDSFRN